MIRVHVQRAPFDPAAELDALEGRGGGAVASFTGIVRGDGGLVAMTLEHYAAMTEPALRGIAGHAAGRWALLGVTVIHRHGRLLPGERIVFVGCASRHRAAAIEATHFLIDWLKTEAPFWKREEWADGSARWVEARVEDDQARDRWSE